MDRDAQITNRKGTGVASEQLPVLILKVLGLAKTKELTLVEVNFQTR